MNNNKNGNRQYFSVRDGILYYFEEPLAETPIIGQSINVLEKLTIPGKSLKNNDNIYKTGLCWLSYIFCIASQGINFERSVEFIRNLKNYSLDHITDPEFVYKEAVKNLRFKQDRYSEAFSFALNYHDGILGLAEDYVEDDKLRDELAKIKWIKGKTASFWNLCLSGTSFLTLDVHNFRQLAGIGLPIKEEFYTPIKKPDGKKDTEIPSYKQYKEIECLTLEFLSKFHEFNKNGKVDGALASAVFWVGGAEAKRNGLYYQLYNKGSYQQDLFHNGSLIFESVFE